MVQSALTGSVERSTAGLASPVSVDRDQGRSSYPADVDSYLEAFSGR